jgi:hypothetical protein
MIQRLLRAPLPLDKSPERLSVFVRSAIARAQAFGFRSRSQIQRFLDYTAGLGLEFDTDPKCSWARKILDMPDLSPDAKIREIDDFLLLLSRNEIHT